MSDGIVRPDWSGGDAGGGEHIESGRSVPIGTPISRPDWGSAAPKEYVAGLRFTQDAKPVQREDWGNGDWRTTGQEVTTPDTTHPLARPENAEVEPGQESDQGRESSQIVGDFDPVVVENLVGFVGRTEAANAALDFLKANANAKPPKDVKVAHNYDLRALGVSPENLPTLQAFANHMAAKGASQSEFSRSIEFAQNLQRAVSKHEQTQSSAQVTAMRQIEAVDVEHRDTAGMTLRNEWGADFQNNLDTISSYLETLPQDERQRIERYRIDGRAFGNDPERLKEMLAEAKTAKPNDLSRQEIEQIMKTDRSRYNRDAGMQSRYRQLLQQN